MIMTNKKKCCPFCAAAVEPGEKFCGECGNKLSNTSTEIASFAGNWLFSDSANKVTFHENGTVTFYFEKPSMTEEDQAFLFGKDVEIPEEVIDELSNSSKVSGRWQQKGNRLLFDCNNTTLWDVEMRGDRMIGTFYYISDENNEPRFKVILEREGVDLSGQEIFAPHALKDLNDGSCDALLYKGFSLFFLSGNDYEALNEAIKIFAQAVKIDPKRPEAFVGIGMCYFTLGDNEKALPHIEQALMNNFGVDARYETILFEHLSDGDEPEDGLEYEFTLDYVVMTRAMIHFNLGNIDQAEKDLDGVFDNIPEEYTVDKLLLRAGIFIQRNKLEEALQYVEKALAIDPDSADAHYTMGLLLLENGNVEAAIKAFSQSISLDPEDPDALMARAKAFGTLGATREMLEDSKAINKIIRGGYSDTELLRELNELLDEFKLRL
jgi:tetratricopeptide (TPR) repeat protein